MKTNFPAVLRCSVMLCHKRKKIHKVYHEDVYGMPEQQIILCIVDMYLHFFLDGNFLSISE